MNAWHTVIEPLLQQVARTLPDTIVTKQIAAEQSNWDKVLGVASGLMTLSLLVLTVALVPAAWNFRKSYKKVSDLLDRVYADVFPLMGHASAIADNVNYITTSVRVDIQQVNQTIAHANQRLNEAIALTEERLNEFNALLKVVQHEAEEAFVSTASTVRGVRVGAAAFRDEALGASAARELEDPLDADDDLLLQQEELTDGDDSTGAIDDDDSTRTGTAGGPRIRPRGRVGGPA
jgi:uncharacterized protein YoxC